MKALSVAVGRVRQVSLFAVMFCVLLVGCSGDNGRERFALAGGATVDLNQLNGRVLVVNYWAIWCAPCRHEVPELNRLAASYRDTVQVVGFNYDKVAGQILQQQVAELGIEFPSLVRDPADWLGHSASGVLPETLIIAANGELSSVLVGPQTVETLLQAVERARVVAEK